MGGIPCDIVISCGAMKSATSGLADFYRDGNAFMRSTAISLVNLEDEICDGREDITEYATDAEKASIKASAAEAWTLHLGIEKLIADRGVAKKFPHGPELDGDEQKLLGELLAFRTRQAKLFHDIAVVHENDQ